MQVVNLFKIPLVQVFTEKKELTYNTKDLGQLFGIELEIEYADSFEAPVGFRTTEDGSLRNYGYEFISYPMNYTTLHEALIEFFDVNKCTKKNYSERCSTHVHVNCQDMTLDQIASVILIYQVFEGLLFQFAGAERDKNIFCVPLKESAITYCAANLISAGDINCIYEWPKYTAMNLRPLCDKGTIEFRHLPGTCDVGFIATWLRLLNHIFVMAKNNSYQTVKEMLSELNSNSHYMNALTTIFNSDARELMFDNYQQSIEDGVLNMKYSLLPGIKINKNKIDWPQPGIVNEERQVFNNMFAQYLAAPPINLHPIDLAEVEVGRAVEYIIEGNV